MMDDFDIIDDPAPRGPLLPYQKTLLEFAKINAGRTDWRPDSLPMILNRRWPTDRDVRYSSMMEAIRAGKLIRGMSAAFTALDEFSSSVRQTSDGMLAFRCAIHKADLPRSGGFFYPGSPIATGWDRGENGVNTIVRMRRRPDGTTEVISVVRHPDAQFPRRRGEHAANHLDRVFRTIQRGK